MELKRKTEYCTGIFLMSLMTSKWTVIQTASDQYYHHVDRAMTWSDARAYCMVKHSELTSVDNQTHMDQLRFTTAGTFWIGLERRDPDRWVWSDGSGTAGGYFNWKEGEPNHSQERCGEVLEDGSWNDHSCDSTNNLMCYTRLSDGGQRLVHVGGDTAWQDGQKHCRTHYTDLATIRSDADNIAVASTAGGNNVWFGLVRDKWVWSDGRQTSFRAWLPGKPNTQGSKTCACVTDEGQWDNAECDTKMSFSCQGRLRSKMTSIKMEVTSEVDMNTVSSSLLLQLLQERLEGQSVSDFTLRWKTGQEGQVFTRTEKEQPLPTCGPAGTLII